MALNHTLPHTPVELEPVEYTGHTVPSTVRVCPNMRYTIPLINHRIPTTEHTYFKAYTQFSGVRCTIYCCLCIHISYTDIYSICPRKQHPTIGLVPFFLMKSPINTQDVNQTQHFWWRMPIDFWWYSCLFHQITAYYSHDAIPGKNGACDDLKPGRRLKDNDKTIHGNSWEWWKHELEPVSFLFGAISIEQAGELQSGSLTMSNCLTYLAWKSSFFCWKLVYKWRSL
jgi:hypothetical protein